MPQMGSYVLKYSLQHALENAAGKDLGESIKS